MSHIDIDTLFNDLAAAFGATWAARGYALEPGPDGVLVTGDEGQFYLDAVANDAQAPLAMEYLRLYSPECYEEFREMARGDLIDLDDSQQVFLRGRTIAEHLAASR